MVEMKMQATMYIKFSRGFQLLLYFRIDSTESVTQQHSRYR